MVVVRVILVLLICLSCGSRMDYVLKAAKKIDKNGEFVVATTYDSNGQSLTLNKDTDKMTLFIFSSRFCGVCIEETEHFIASLNDPMVEPSKVTFITLLVGGLIDDADFFKMINGIPWAVGVDPDGDLIRQYCGTNLTPCLVIQDPKQGIIKTHAGVMSIEEIKSYTGEWE